MRLLAILLVLATAAVAQTDADRAAIEKSFSSTLEFTGDGLRDWERYGPGASDTSPPLSEVSSPRLVWQRITFLGDRVAIVEANLTRFGSMIVVTRVPMLLVMRKVGDRWQVDVVRLLQ